MAQMTFDGTSHDTRIDSFKVFEEIAEGDQFRWTHMGTGRRETKKLAIWSSTVLVTYKFIGKKIRTRYFLS